MDWQWNSVIPYIPALLQGLELTLEITLMSVALGFILGIPVAVCRMSSFWPLRTLTIIYIEFFRGTPTLIQLVWIYYALPILTGLQLPDIASVVIALSANAAAFYGEAYRSGILSVAREQYDSADVLNLGGLQTLRYVVLPQATRIMIPVFVSLSVSLFKESSLVSTLGVVDLMYQARIIATTTYRPFEILTVAAAIYFLVAYPVTILSRQLERSLKVAELRQ
jgi:polar amino acid transport system permease protein